MTAEVNRRRRGEELEAAILDAAREELAEAGWAGLTMDRVAARAQTSKPVLYRRWPSKAQLALALMRRDVPQAAALTDTGSLRGDLIVLLQQLSHRFDDLPSGVIIGLLAETLTDPEYSKLVQDLLTGEIPALVEEVLRRAVVRGEIGSTGTTRSRRLPLDLLRSEIFLRAATPTDAYIEETVDEILLPLYSSI